MKGRVGISYLALYCIIEYAERLPYSSNGRGTDVMMIPNIGIYTKVSEHVQVKSSIVNKNKPSTREDRDAS